ncbi:hypothetical protein RMATCC62417_10917 [Rhizopus microsporus]|nr:hypothetical protein RMATCC62417_10917 [Rhizopus microsporus]
MNSSLDPSANSQTSKECEICHAADWKYTCPRCLIHTCSVPCVKKHKLDTQCSGERDKTAYVPLKSYNESTMMNDYTYLEDVSRQSDNLTRARRELTSKNMKLKLRQLHKQANYLGIKYFSLPVGMTRNTKNQSNYNQKSRQIYWTIEVNFYRNNEKNHYLEHGFPGNRPFHDFFHNMLFSETPRGKDSFSIMRHELKYFIDAESRVPSFIRALAPAGSLELHEEAWNAYPYCKTVLTNGYMGDNFSIVYETLHVDGSRGEIENALKISDEDLKKRNVIIIDVANDPIEKKDYKPDEDPKTFKSEKTGREEKRVLIRPLKRSHEEVDHEKGQDEKRLKMDNEENKTDDIEEGELDEESKVDELEELDEESKVDELEEEEGSRIDELDDLEEESSDVKEKEDASE